MIVDEKQLQDFISGYFLDLGDSSWKNIGGLFKANSDYKDAALKINELKKAVILAHGKCVSFEMR